MLPEVVRDMRWLQIYGPQVWTRLEASAHRERCDVFDAVSSAQSAQILRFRRYSWRRRWWQFFLRQQLRR